MKKNTQPLKLLLAKSSKVTFAIATLVLITAINPADSKGANDSQFEKVSWERDGDKAKFPGGKSALVQFLNKHLKYPKRAKEMNITGTVQIEFDIDENGQAKNYRVVKSIHSDLDNEAIRVLKLMPGWSPAKRANKRVKVGMRLPVKFTLR